MEPFGEYYLLMQLDLACPGGGLYELLRAHVQRRAKSRWVEVNCDHCGQMGLYRSTVALPTCGPDCAAGELVRTHRAVHVGQYISGYYFSGSF